MKSEKPWFLYLLPVLLFLSVTAISGRFAMAFVAAALALSWGKLPKSLAQARSVPLTWGVLAYGGLCLASGLWSHYGAYAREEAVKTLVALAIFLIVVLRVQKGGLRHLLWSLNGVLAVVGLLCIDAASTTVLTRGFSAVMDLLWSNYDLARMGYETGIRITGIYSNANVSGGVLAFGLLLSLHLYLTEEQDRGRFLSCCLMGVQALAFFLSFSMGAMAAFALTCLVYVAFMGKGKRLGLFLLMLEAVAVTVVCAFGAYSGLGKAGGAALVPVALALVCGPLIWAADRFIGKKLAGALAGKDKLVSWLCGGLAAAGAVYAALALTLNGAPLALTDGGVGRALALESGTYSVTTLQGADPQVLVYSQNDQELMMHTQTDLYEGPLSQAQFTVPEGSKAVWFQMAGQGELTEVTLSDGSRLPLGYSLLPGFAANRLQALWANQNFIQRLVFFRDGLKLWLASPIYGWGAGGVEGQLTSVQSFYYESKYIHNHLIQVMDEIGLLGLAAFLFMLGSAVWTLARKKDEMGEEPLFAMLAAALTMMTAHSMTEVVWSTQFYQAVTFILLAILVIRFGEKEVQSSRRGSKGLVFWGARALLLVFALFQAGSLMASMEFSKLVNASQPQDTMAALSRMDTLEIYDDTTYKTNLMVRALESGDGTTAQRCVNGLLAKEEFDSSYYAAAYYYLPLHKLPQMFQAAHVGLRQEASNPDAWNSMFNLYAQAFAQLSPEEMGQFVEGVCATGALLEENNVGRMGQITLSQRNRLFLDTALLIQSQGMADEDAYPLLAAVLAK